VVPGSSGIYSDYNYYYHHHFTSSSSSSAVAADSSSYLAHRLNKTAAKSFNNITNINANLLSPKNSAS
jgi:hypothetical protein